MGWGIYRCKYLYNCPLTPTLSQCNADCIGYYPFEQASGSKPVFKQEYLGKPVSSELNREERRKLSKRKKAT